MNKSATPQEPHRATPPESAVESGDDGDDRIIGQAFRLSLLVILVFGGVVAFLVWWLNRKPELAATPAVPAAPPMLRATSRVTMPKVQFTDVTRAAGIAFLHVNGGAGEKLLPETMGGGCAALDFDNDGDQDILLINSCYWPWDESAKDKPAPTMALYRNDGSWKFTDVSKEAGLAITMYGMGVAVGDYDNDGWVDLFISGVGGNKLLKNDHGTFADVTDQAGVAGEGGWSSSAGFIDYDNDGDLDLFVCDYVRWSREIDKAQDFKLLGVGRAFGPPTNFDGAFPHLYRNDGGKFSDVSAAAGIQVRNPNTKVPIAKSLGLSPVDVDRDGWIDLIVANDTVQNFLFHNQKNGTFVEIGATAGVAFDPAGNARGAMGIDSACFRNNAAVGVLIGNFTNEMASLFVSQNVPLLFVDEANSTGLGPATRLQLKFGVFFFDYDLDGRLDALTANGHLEEEINKVQQSQRYEQPPQLFWNCGPEELTEFRPADEAHCGKDFVMPMVGRGATYADFDGDGDLDLLITALRGTPRLLRNDQQTGHHWLRLKLVGKKSNRDAIGAWVELTAGGLTQRRQVMPTRSYLSQSELPVTFGLGKNDTIEKVVVRWPGGSEQQVKDVKLDALSVVEETP